MTDYAMEQEMEIEALEAIMMEDFKEVDGQGPDGLDVDTRCFLITVAPKDADEEEPTEIPVRLALVFTHTPNYPDEPPHFKLRSIRGVRDADLKAMKQKLDAEVQDNLGMAMMYTLAQSAKEQLRAIVCGEVDNSNTVNEDGKTAAQEEEERRKEAARKAGTPVTKETWTAWFERFQAERLLEKAKLSTTTDIRKQSRPSGRNFFEHRTAAMEGKEELEEDFELGSDFDDEELLDEFLLENDQDALGAAQRLHHDQLEDSEEEEEEDGDEDDEDK
mmetsp:Transcript_1962/g.3967  ORF Transcript_1962/g.3967 Transcript_1962/m.3967 type:complete len:275 (-) Transcript_1962:392-1216(-)|eukprot:CAMPEP_0118923800 /NCGR_PEP_ID=MMETSP1169-20130426/2198_1 /TAXON_ID=36882 /ORGANISM="Pyramimonas obovata, Strain CCMP722" /LENGTH=274 /DNA_ID=CAMNT_0006864849 /DNA_START=273 /DNA_END=1097 /DNA_ORIENTATION=-